MNVVCVIGARGGSKGVAGKNIRPMLGKPMIAWSIEHARACPEINHVVVSTDSDAIAEVARASGADVPFMRPADLANDAASKWPVWQHALEACERYYGEPIDILVDLDCTSPLREPADISRAIALFRESGADAVISVCEARKNPYFNVLEMEQGRLVLSKTLSQGLVVRRQDAPPVFEQVASIYVFSPAYIRRGTSILSGNVIGYDIGSEKSLDVDSELDFEMIEYLLRRRLAPEGGGGRV